MAPLTHSTETTLERRPPIARWSNGPLSGHDGSGPDRPWPGAQVPSTHPPGALGSALLRSIDPLRNRRSYSMYLA